MSQETAYLTPHTVNMMCPNLIKSIYVQKRMHQVDTLGVPAERDMIKPTLISSTAWSLLRLIYL